MGCCGCSLAGSAVTAVVLGLLESLLGLSWNILVIVVLESNRHGDNSELFGPNRTLAMFEETFTTPANISVHEETLSQWDTLRKTLTSEEASINGRIFQVVVAALVVNAFWLMTTLGLAVGNAEKCRDMLKPWIATTVIVTISDIAATIYFIFKSVKDIGDDGIDDFNEAFFSNIYIFLACMFSRGGPIVWIANIALCIFVAQRVKEIEVIKKKKMPFSTEFNITPYSLQPPYEAFEAADSSPRTPKNLRPHTPPPDYEGPNGYLYKKPRPYSNVYETMTLPLSVGSSRVSATTRPLSQGSYLYDDRVELQHRTSATAETVVNHAYENKGLVMESEGWIGIPRPTLKSAR